MKNDKHLHRQTYQTLIATLEIFYETQTCGFEYFGQACFFFKFQPFETF